MLNNVEVVVIGKFNLPLSNYRKAVVKISSLESLLALCVGLCVCVCVSERPSQEFQCVWVSFSICVCVSLREIFAGVAVWKIQDS